ncbi:MAG: hypothetical protein ACJASV_000074 [Pseudorhodobacter sp.]|jgi:hypothetical protein
MLSWFADAPVYFWFGSAEIQGAPVLAVVKGLIQDTKPDQGARHFQAAKRSRRELPPNSVLSSTISDLAVVLGFRGGQ